MKILYTASVLSHICQFHLPVMEHLQRQGHVVHVAARDNLAEKNGLQLKYTDEYHNIPFQRSPKDERNLGAYRELKALLDREHYDVVLCNTPVVGVLTRLAAGKARKQGTKVIYMAHGFHFYTGAPKKYWLIYPLEKWLANHKTDMVITINQEDYQRAKEKFRCRVEHIFGVGVRADRYRPATAEERHAMRIRENLKDEDFVIICAKELMYDNNQKTLLKAAAKVRERIPELKVLLAGNGPDEKKLKDLTSELGLDDIVSFLGYRTDLEKVVPGVDLVVSCSYREGMPFNIIEAMLSARPVVASHNRGHNELITDGETGYLFDMLDFDMLAEKIAAIYQDHSMADAFGKQAYAKIQSYTSEAVLQQMDRIMESMEK